MHIYALQTRAVLTVDLSLPDKINYGKLFLIVLGNTISEIPFTNYFWWLDAFVL